jgi:hypothetical protein
LNIHVDLLINPTHIFFCLNRDHHSPTLSPNRPANDPLEMLQEYAKRKGVLHETPFLFA